MKTLVRLYHRRVLTDHQEKPSRKAEALRRVIEPAKELYRALEQLPAALRAQIEPDAGVVECLFADIIGHSCVESLPGFDQALFDLIVKAEGERAIWNVLVSRERSRRRSSQRRDNLALGIKALVMGLSPKFAKDEHEAESWVATALSTLGVRYPDPQVHRTEFRRMFTTDS
jgi:hypothetical protein